MENWQGPRWATKELVNDIHNLWVGLVLSVDAGFEDVECIVIRPKKGEYLLKFRSDYEWWSPVLKLNPEQQKEVKRVFGTPYEVRLDESVTQSYQVINKLECYYEWWSPVLKLNPEQQKEVKRVFGTPYEVRLDESVTQSYQVINKLECCYKGSFCNYDHDSGQRIYGICAVNKKPVMCDEVRERLGRKFERPTKLTGMGSFCNYDHDSGQRIYGICAVNKKPVMCDEVRERLGRKFERPTKLTGMRTVMNGDVALEIAYYADCAVNKKPVMCDEVRERLGRKFERPTKLTGMRTVMNGDVALEIAYYADGSRVVFDYHDARLVGVVPLDRNGNPKGFAKYDNGEMDTEQLSALLTQLKQGKTVGKPNKYMGVVPLDRNGNPKGFAKYDNGEMDTEQLSALLTQLKQGKTVGKPNKYMFIHDGPCYNKFCMSVGLNPFNKDTVTSRNNSFYASMQRLNVYNKFKEYWHYLDTLI